MIVKVSITYGSKGGVEKTFLALQALLQSGLVGCNEIESNWIALSVVRQANLPLLTEVLQMATTNLEFLPIVSASFIDYSVK